MVTTFLIQDVVAEAERLLRVQPGLILGRGRSERVVLARWSIARAMRNLGWTLESIGQAMRKDHTSIIYALNHFDERTSPFDDYYPNVVAQLETALMRPRPEGPRTRWETPAPH